MSIDQLAPAEPLSSGPVRGKQAWRDDYPWLHGALREIGPGARAAADRWRVRIEDELKTTLDFKVRADGTAAVWCGMSSYDFHHDPTPKELLEGLAVAYRRELGRLHELGGRGRGLVQSPGPRTKVSARPTPVESPTPQPAVQALPAVAEDSLTRALGSVILPRVVQLVLIFVAVTALTLVLSAVANAVH
jgi:hypothetical protein